MMKKQITIMIGIFILASILNLNSIMALDKNIGFTADQINLLKEKGISNLNLTEYPCKEGYTCYSIAGDINDKLVSIPDRVKDNCIKSDVLINYTKTLLVKNRYGNFSIINVVVPVHRRDCTGQWNYRLLSDNEKQKIIDDTLKKKLSEVITEDKYYPIPKNTGIKFLPIEIGKTIGRWINIITGAKNETKM